MAIYLISSLKKGKLKINGLALLRHGQYFKNAIAATFWKWKL
jgi:hypothetical protein